MTIWGERESQSNEITGHGIVRHSGGSGGGPEKIVVPDLTSTLICRYGTSFRTHSRPGGGY